MFLGPWWLLAYLSTLGYRPALLGQERRRSQYNDRAHAPSIASLSIHSSHLFLLDDDFQSYQKLAKDSSQGSLVLQARHSS